MYTYKHTDMHAYVHTCLHTYVQNEMHLYIHTYIQTCKRTFLLVLTVSVLILFYSWLLSRWKRYLHTAVEAVVIRRWAWTVFWEKTATTTRTRKTTTRKTTTATTTRTRKTTTTSTASTWFVINSDPNIIRSICVIFQLYWCHFWYPSTYFFACAESII